MDSAGRRVSAEVIDGLGAAQRLKQQVSEEIELLGAGRCRLATVMVGADYSAAAYERRLRRVATELGAGYQNHVLPASCELADVLTIIGGLNADPRVSGILILRPLPPHISEELLFPALTPAKDIEAVHPVNAGLLALGTPRFLPSTPASVFYLLDCWLDQTGESLTPFYRRSTIVVVGRSNNVGKPAMSIGYTRGAVVVSCDEWASRTGRLAEVTRTADVLIVAAGVTGLIGAKHVSPGAVVLDVGINPVADLVTGRVHLVGDVDFESVATVARAISPVPGGVGPVTDVWLIRNTVTAARLAAGD